MSTTMKIFQIEKTVDDIRQTILTNVIHMLTERNLLKRENLDKNIKTLINKQSDDYTYNVDIDNYKNESEKQYLIKIFFQKVASISKQSNIIDFLNKNKDKHKIIIVKSINDKSGQHIVTNYRNTELFLENELMINLMNYDMVPRYEIADINSETFKKFCEKYNCKKRNIPKLFMSDPVARYYNLKREDIVRIIRPSDITSESPSYRIVI